MTYYFGKRPQKNILSDNEEDATGKVITGVTDILKGVGRKLDIYEDAPTKITTAGAVGIAAVIGVVIVSGILIFRKK